MEILKATETCFVANDELLNFTLEDEDERRQTIFEGAFASSSSSSSSSLTAAAAAAVFSNESGSGLFPEFVEEELEWLSNKDAFPSVDTCFGILSDNPEFISNHHSPVSVLTTATTTTSSTSCFSVFEVPGKFPVRPRSKRRRRMGDQQQWLSRVNMNGPPLPMKGRRCLHCYADKTPQWRAGPMGPKTLCNACGVRYKSGRLVPEYRPVNSPTFSSTLHSNSHRKVVEMRRHKYVG